MHDFHFIDGELYCETVKVREIASHDRTPFYLYSRKTISDHYRKLDNAFSPVPHLICYSLKANSNIAICRILAQMGAGADITSGGELYKAKMAGMPPEKIVYAGVGKTREEIKYAIENGILMFNVESVQELYAINETAAAFGKKASVAFRLNPEVEIDTHTYTKTGTSENKFGIAAEELEELFMQRDKFSNVEMKGIHVHIGSQIADIQPYIKSVSKAADFAKTLKSRGINLEWLNIGGGMGIIYKDEKPSTAAEFAHAVLPLAEPTGLKLIIEPGRFIMGNAGILVTKVLYIKKSKSRRFVVVDAGMNDLIRPALYQAYHDIKPLTLPSKGRESEVVDVVGPICESGDFFAMDRDMPRVGQGDLLAVFSVGAYGFSMASNYNSRPRTAELLVEGASFRLIRERETYNDLVCGERHRFTKMCASGNDFIVIDNRSEIYPDGSVLASGLCKRCHSVGADGLLLLENGKSPGNLKMRIFNPDGSEAEMCGNGMRCIAAFAYKERISGREARFETLAGIISTEVTGDEVKIKMSDPSDIEISLKLSVDGKEYPASFINTGVPHTVIVVDKVDKIAVESSGRKIRCLERFQPEGTNVDFVEVVNEEEICLRTYERGVEAETLACGTGAAASAVICCLLGKVKAPVEVKTKGGSTLKVHFKKNGGIKDVYLQGDAVFVYDGTFDRIREGSK